MTENGFNFIVIKDAGISYKPEWPEQWKDFHTEQTWIYHHQGSSLHQELYYLGHYATRWWFTGFVKFLIPIDMFIYQCSSVDKVLGKWLAYPKFKTTSLLFIWK